MVRTSVARCSASATSPATPWAVVPSSAVRRRSLSRASVTMIQPGFVERADQGEAETGGAAGDEGDRRSA